MRPVSLLSILSISCGVTATQQSTIPPSQDPFYAAPANISSYQNGEIVATRPTSDPIQFLRGGQINIQDAYLMSYKSEDTFGNDTLIVATVLVPYNADFGKLVSYEVFEDSASPDCAISWTLSGRGTAEITQLDVIFIQSALSAGLPMVLPDHGGPRATFLANIAAAHYVLDGIRAVTSSSSPIPVTSAATKVLWGYSGGALPVLAAAEQAPIYAPELEITAAAAGGTVPSIQDVIFLDNKEFPAGLIVAGVLGIANEYPAINDIVNERLVPGTSQAFLNGRTQCLVSIAATFAYQDIFAYVNDPNELFVDPVIVPIVNENNFGLRPELTPKIPMYIYHGVQDEITPVNATDMMVNIYCANGGQVEYHRDPDAEHLLDAVFGSPSAFQWLQARLNGEPAQSGCHISTEPSFVLGGASALPQFAINALADLAGAPEGLFAPYNPASNV